MDKLDACFGSEGLSNFEIGQMMYLDYGLMGNHLKVFLVGAEKGEYLILKNPTSIVPNNFQLRSDDEVTLRYVLHGKAYGFQSHLIAAIAKPGNLLFVAYPKLIAEHSFRSDERVSSYIPAELNMTDFKAMGHMQDLAHTGCAYAMKESQITADVDIETLFSQGNPVVINILVTGMEKEQHLTGHIMQTDQHDGKMLLGIAFDEEAQKANQKVIDYILQLNN